MEKVFVDYKQFINDNADFLSNSFSQILDDSYSSCKFSNIIEDCYKDFSFAKVYFCYESSNSYNEKPAYRDFKSLFILKNPHIDLPCFFTQKTISFSEYSVKLVYKTNFYVVGRPEKLIRFLFTTEVCEAITKMYRNLKCLNIEGVGECIYLIYDSHLSLEEFNNVKNDAIDLSSLFALNEEFNTDHIDSTSLHRIDY